MKKKHVYYQNWQRGVFGDPNLTMREKFADLFGGLFIFLPRALLLGWLEHQWKKERKARGELYSIAAMTIFFVGGCCPYQDVIVGRWAPGIDCYHHDSPVAVKQHHP